MSFPHLLFVLATLCFFSAFRIFEGDNALWVSSALTIIVMISAFAMQFSFFRKAQNNKRIALKRWFQFSGLVFVGMFFFLISGLIHDRGIRIDSEDFELVKNILWATLCVVGIVGSTILDFINHSSPVLLPNVFLKKGLHATAMISMGFLLLFPVNYIANQHNIRKDFSFFKTASPSQSTINIAKAASSPYVIYIFSSASSQVGIELSDYFDELKKTVPMRVKRVDQIAEPNLSKTLKIRSNGYVVVSNESISSESKPDMTSMRSVRPQRIRIGNNIEDKQVKEKLRKFDAQIRKAMIAVERGKLSVYSTTGHSELTWKGNATPARKIRVFKDGLESYNFRLKSFGLTDGLAKEIPDSVAVLLVLGPDLGLSENEYLSIKKYLENGGAILLALEPPTFRQGNALQDTKDFSNDLLNWMGIEFEQGVLLSKTGTQPVTRSKQDRMHFVTKQFEKHPSVSSINADRTQSFGLFVSTAGALKNLKKTERKVTTVVRSPSSSWLETKTNLEPDPEEQRGALPIAMAIQSKKWRAFVASDASIFSDFAMQNTGNQQFSLDVINWLSGQETQSGSLSSEADLPFSPTKEGQAIWFYLSILGVPILVLFFGWIRIRQRRKEQN